MELREVLDALRARWWMALVGVLFGGGVAWGVSLAQTPMYSSSTQFFVSTVDSASTSDAFQGSQFSQQRVTSYARLIAGEELAARVIDRLNLQTSPDALSARISASAAIDTVLVDVTVTDTSPERAQRIAEAVGEEFIDLVAELETPAEGASPIKVTVTDRPEIPEVPSSPKTLRNVALGLLVGLLLGAGLAVLRSAMDRSVKLPEVVVDLTGAPVIGTVPRDGALAKQHIIDRSSNSRTAESYRQLRTNLRFLNVDKPPKVIMVTSAVESEGKTTAVVNLGLALADSGLRVVIVEADLRKPKVTRYLGMIGGVGVTNVLSGTADVIDVLQPYGDGKLSVIAAGPTPPNPGELLASSHMRLLIEALRDENDYVLVDAPPLLPVADSSGLAALMDGVLLSVRYGSTTKDQLGHAAATLDRVGAKILGVVLNIVPPHTELATPYGYAYEPGKHSTG